MSFQTWLKNHPPDHTARWCRELYPWSVLAEVDYSPHQQGERQIIFIEEHPYTVRLNRWVHRPDGRYEYLLHLRADSDDWRVRPWDDEFQVIAGKDGGFITAYTRGVEPLKRAVDQFMKGRFDRVADVYSLPVARVLGQALVAEMVLQHDSSLDHYASVDSGSLAPRAVAAARRTFDRPLFSRGRQVWIDYQYDSEAAFRFARRHAASCEKLIVLYCVAATWKFDTRLPANAQVRSLAEFNQTELGGAFERQVLALQTRLAASAPLLSSADAYRQLVAPSPAHVTITIEHVNEALSRLGLSPKDAHDLAYFLASAVVVNAWIEEERKFHGFPIRKKAYAFKQQVAAAIESAMTAGFPQLELYLDKDYLYARLFDVDFSFASIPLSPDAEARIRGRQRADFRWSGLRLKPRAPLVLAWARALRLEAVGKL